MSKIAEWRIAQRVHAELIRNSGELCCIGFVDIKAHKSIDFARLGDEWKTARIRELYSDLLEFSRQRVLRLAREALAEVETVKADAMLDIESIEEDAKPC
jgi:hypothetical protein